ncbi:MAG: ABC transporter permease [Phycisphaerales bacterium]|nr:ABC transporter permease [Phycisphaerales bacterium]
MTSAAMTLRSSPPTGLRGFARSLRVVAIKELVDALSSRWFLVNAAVFGLLAVGLSFVSLAGAGVSGLSGFGRTAAGMLNIVLLVVPLMALTAGAATVAGERERGMLVYMLAQPVSRAEVLLGKYLGAAAALVGSLCLGFGASAILMAWRGGTDGIQPFVAFFFFTVLLALSMLAVGVLISVLARRSGVAVGIAVFVWLTLTLLTDLGLMAGTLAFRLRVEELFSLAVANPLQACKMAAMQQMHASLDILGPAGLYAMQTHGEHLRVILLAVLAGWIVVPLAASLAVFSRRSPL